MAPLKEEPKPATEQPKQEEPKESAASQPAEEAPSSPKAEVKLPPPPTQEGEDTSAAPESDKSQKLADSAAKVKMLRERALTVRAMSSVENETHVLSPPAPGFINHRFVVLRREGKLGLHIATAEGMVYPRVLKIMPNGAAAKLGSFQAGDCILRVRSDLIASSMLMSPFFPSSCASPSSRSMVQTWSTRSLRM